MRKYCVISYTVSIPMSIIASLLLLGFCILQWTHIENTSHSLKVNGRVSQIAHNNSDSRIEVLFWSNYGISAPLKGEFSAGTKKIVFGNYIKWVPSSTIVFWTVEGDSREYSQTIDLSEMPKDIAGGEIIFELNKANEWTVSYAKSTSPLHDSN